MPSLARSITYLFEDISRSHRAAVLHFARWIGGMVLLALVLEIFVFNFNYFLSADYKAINLANKIELRKTDDGAFSMTSSDHGIEFTNLNTEVHDLYLDFNNDQPAQVLPVKILFTDEAHLTYFDTTEYTVGIPLIEVSTKSEQSQYINLNTTGLVENLRIEIVGDDVSYPVTLNTVYLNAPRPFNFVWWRFAIVLGVFLLAFLFRPHSAIYSIRIVDHPRASRAALIGAVSIESLLICGYLFFGSNLVGVATADYNEGSWDGVSAVNTFEVGGDNAQQYADLARALAAGQLYLEEEPPQWLQDMEFPYDKGARDEAQKATGEPYLFDVAFFEGHYYVYFGIVPVLLFYLPFYLLTGANFPTAIGVLIMALAFVLGCSLLLDRFARHHFKKVSLGVYLLVQIPVIACCGILYLVKFPTFYSLPIASALAFSVWGLYCWMRGRRSRRAGGWYALGSLCMALVAGCRPQLLVLSFIAFPLFWRHFITGGALRTPRGMRQFACLLAPYLVVAVGLGLYNYARFGSFTDFGANYNLTMNDMTQRGFVAGRLAPAIFSYFLQPPSVSGVFPFIQPAPFETTYIGQTVHEVTFGGVFACLPILWVLPFIGRVLEVRRAQRATRTIFWVLIILVLSGFVVPLLDAELAGILQRYYADFTVMFLAAAALVIFIANERLAENQRVMSLLRPVLIALVAISVTYSVLLCFVPETGWYSDVYDWAYRDIIESILFWS